MSVVVFMSVSPFWMFYRMLRTPQHLRSKQQSTPRIPQRHANNNGNIRKVAAIKQYKNLAIEQSNRCCLAMPLEHVHIVANKIEMAASLKTVMKTQTEHNKWINQKDPRMRYERHSNQNLNRNAFINIQFSNGEAGWLSIPKEPPINHHNPTRWGCEPASNVGVTLIAIVESTFIHLLNYVH